MKNFFFKVAVAVVLALALSTAYLVTPQAFFSLDNRLRDFMFVMRGELPKNDKVVIVDIDEKSLQQYGQWPWSRDLIAKLLYKLTDAKAGIIGLDMVFAEADRTSPHLFAKKFPQLTDKLENYDEILASCFMQTPVVGGYIFTFDKSTQKKTPLIPAVFIQKGVGKNTPVLQPKGVILNIDILQDALYSSGFFNNTPDNSGMIRNIPLVMKYDGVIYPSLALEMLRIYTNTSKVEILGDASGVENIKLNDITIPTDNVGRLVVNFRGASKHFTYISAADILNEKFDPQKIKNKFVLVGTSAIGLFDLRSIPLDNVIAGVEVHANAIDNILSGDFLHKPPQIVLYDLTIIWGIVFFFLLLFSFVSSWAILPVALVSLYVLAQIFFMLLFDFGLVLNLLFPLLAFSLTLLLSVGYDYITTAKQKDQVKKMLGKKVSPAVMEYLLEHSDEDLVISSNKEVSIFFSDIRSFTSISEKLGSPDQVIHLLNEYMTPMVENIVAHKGTIDKFIGDAIMAYWNAPVEVKNHADEAVKSAIEQIQLLQNIHPAIRKHYGVEIAIGIGIHTGTVTAGDMGSFGRSDYTIIGDNVNLASRIEGLTKHYEAQILISEATHSKLQDSYPTRPIDLVEVKGKQKAVEIFEVLCPNNTLNTEEIQRYKEATSLFRDAQIKEAYAIYSELQQKNPSKLYQIYMQRCQEYLRDPSKPFSAVTKMQTK